MSSILFAFEVCAFLVVIAWAYRNDRLAPGQIDTGLLAMKLHTGEGRKKKQPRWRKDDSAGAASWNHVLKAPQPRWKSRFAPKWR